MRPRQVPVRHVAVFVASSALVLSTAAVAAATPGHPPAPGHPAAVGRPSVSAVPRPGKDGFYRYHGSHGPLRHVRPGTPLRTRKVTLTLGSATTYPAEQVLYRTTSATGRAIVSVTTFALPATGTVDPKVVEYESFYDALGSHCDPSYVLRGGNPGSANQTNAAIEQGVVNTLLTDGFIVTDPDFENERLDYVAGTESGMSALDAVKATLSVLRLKAPTTPVGLMGYSGGSIASDWASELAPRYAPHLHLVGVSEGGVPVDLAHNLRYVDGSQQWSSVMPAALIGISRGYDLPLRHYLSARGRTIVRAESHQCIGQFLGAYPGLTVKRLVKPRYAHLFQVPLFRRTVNKLIMGSAPGRPREPLMMVAGNQDGTGDGVMVEGDEQALAHEYCHQGVRVDFEQLTGLDHDSAGVAWIPQAIAYLTGRFAGTPPTDNCASIGKGNSLAPIKPHRPRRAA